MRTVTLLPRQKRAADWFFISLRGENYSPICKSKRISG
nr:MAG TPA: hypothetical protein [Caudoviricetes sp.]